MKTAISIPDPIFEEAEELARRMHVSRSQLYVKALSTFVKEQRYTGVTEALNKVYESEQSSMDNVLAEMQLASLPDKGW